MISLKVLDLNVMSQTPKKEVSLSVDDVLGEVAKLMKELGPHKLQSYSEFRDHRVVLEMGVRDTATITMGI